MKYSIRIPGVAAAAVLFFIALGAVAQQESETPRANGAPAVSKAPIPPDGKEMHFRVVDAETGKPIAGVNVRAWVRANLVTDEDGSCAFALPAPKAAGGGRSGDFYYRINFAKDGYVPRIVSWSRAQGDRVEDIPAEYTAKLEQAASIGGFVKDHAGEAIAGARVVFSGINPAAPGQREKTTVAPSYHVERTDENGHWHCNHLPRDFTNMTFRVSHPDYLPATFGCSGSEAGGPDVVALPLEEFLADKAVMSLGHGIELSGTVVDSAGKPVAGVAITRNHEWRNSAALFETDDEGRFKMLNLRPGTMFLTFQAKGLEAQTLKVENEEQMPAINLVMKPGKVFKGKVVDAAGQPIAGATVQMDRLDLKPLEFDWRTITDADGRFVWDSAPEDAHPYFISANGYNSRSEPALIADGEDKVIVLRKTQDGKVFIDGKVVDAESKKPVQKFTLITREFRQNAPGAHWLREVTNAGGDYSAAVGQDCESYLIEIRADGYLPQLSVRQNSGDGDRRIDLELQKGEGLAGVVYLPDGKPAAGAEVAVCYEGAGAILGARRLVEQFLSNVTVTAADGRFAFAPPDNPRVLYAASDEGFAALDLDGTKPPHRMTLRPWGRIEGKALNGGEPLTNANISLEQPFPFMKLGFSYWDFLAKTDARGNFVFSNVPPIEVRLTRQINNISQNPLYVVMQPGEITNVVYGGTGRTLAGRLAVAGYTAPINWPAQQARFAAKVASPEVPQFEDEEAQKKWMDHFWKSDEGKEYVRSQRTFAVKLEADGTFTVDGVPPGQYELTAQLRAFPQQPAQSIGTLNKDIAVEEGPPGKPQAPQHLGTLEIGPIKSVTSGDGAPLFEVKTIDGATLKLADFRGKFVLLDFWATWCAPCRGETPYLKAAYETYGKDPRFAMIGLSLDQAPAAPRDYARQNSVHWIQGFLGEWSKAEVPNLYGVEGIPAIFLIDPTGKIAARDLRGDAISQAIGKALGAN